ncbi:MAG: hypothetical protein K2Z80_26670 [Xanthobacteraceae bacterium]|nr:hypothetical protein [Xanthobacteraceae bacterium]
MSFFDFAAVALSVAICLVPACLLRRQHHARAQDFFVSSRSTPLGVIGNSAVASTLRLAAVGPFFAWGATGDVWPAVVASGCLGLGFVLFYQLRGPIVQFVGGALREDRSITVHAFIARQHGDDATVRLLAASLTLFALFGLITGEAIAVAAMLKPVMGSTALVCLSVLGMLILMLLCAVLSGGSGAMASAQLQLGMAYLGLIGSAALLLYLQASMLGPMPPHGTLAIGLVALWCVFVLVYRRSKYVDTNLLRLADPDRPPRGAAALKRFQQLLNPVISIFVVLAIVIAGMLLYFIGLSGAGRESLAALQVGTNLPAAALIALILLPLLYPLVDVANWQRLAAIEKHIVEGGFEPGLRPGILRSFFRMAGTEGALLGLLMCMFGALAVMATQTPGSADVMPAFVTQLVSDQNEVTVVILPLLLAGVSAIALSTMLSMFSASLSTIRYDILPWFRPELSPGAAPAADEAVAMRCVTIAGVGFLAAIVAAFLAAEAAFRISISSSAFLALLFALGSAQLVFLPLVLAPLMARTSGGSGALSRNWALAIMGCGALGGAVAAAIHVMTGREAWLWAVVPVCLGMGLLAAVMARLWPVKP